MYTCLLAPLIAHLLDLLLKDKNIWTTERILIVYLALLTGQIIFHKICQIFKERGLYDKGFRLGDSDALEIAVCMMLVSIVMFNYNSYHAILLLIGLSVIAIIVLVIDRESIHISFRNLCISGIITLIIIIYEYVTGFNLSITQWGIYILCQFLVCVAFDVLIILCRRAKSYKRKKKREKKDCKSDEKTTEILACSSHIESNTNDPSDQNTEELE